MPPGFKNILDIWNWRHFTLEHNVVSIQGKENSQGKLSLSGVYFAWYRDIIKFKR